MPFDSLIDGSDILAGLIGFWRFVFSKDYRRRKLKDWKSDWLSAFFEILLGLFGFALCIGIVAIIFHLIFR